MKYVTIFKYIATVCIFFALFLVAAKAQLLYIGDANGDNLVDETDYAQFLSNYAQQVSSGSSDADFNRSGLVDGIDYVIWLMSYGRLSPSPSPTTASNDFIWMPRAELLSLPTSGIPWTNMKNAAYGTWGTPDLKNQDNKYGLKVLAGSLVYARSGDESLRSKVRDGIIAAKRTMDESSEWQMTNGALSLGRQLGAFVIAADFIDLKNFDVAAETELRDWLRSIRTTNVGTHGRWRNLTHTCENSANNWGTFACPSRLAASLYLGDSVDVDRVANIMRAFMGERQYYPSDAPGTNGYFQPTVGGTEGEWYCDENSWTAVSNSCVKLGVNIDGVLGEDASRGGVCCTIQGNGIMYSWEVLQGTFVTTELLYRTGRFGNPYTWSNNALKRSLDFMERNGWGITLPSPYVVWMANKRYGTSYPTSISTSGRIMSWGDWMYQ